VIKRWRRRGLAAINSEVRDGIVPAAGGLTEIDEGPELKPGAGRNYRIIALIIACALFMEQMDATVLATALPTMARDLHVPVTSLSSALIAYLLALAIFIPASGYLADRFGSKTIFRAAIVVFMAGSVLCAWAANLPFLVAARFLQGMGGAMMIPIGRLVLLRSVPKENMLSAMSWLIMPALLGPILGPPIGGFIVTYLDWRWIFYLNLPIGILGLVLVTIFLGQIRGERVAKLDVPGFLLSGLSLGCLLSGFEMTSRPGELARALGLIAVGLVAGAIYIRHALKRPDPILDLSLMRVASFRLSVIGGSLTRITQGAQPFLLPLMLQVGFGMSAAVSGAITIATAIGSLIMKSLAPRLLRRFGYRNSMVFAGLAGCVGYAACGFLRPSWPIPMVFLCLMTAAFFMSFQFTAYNTIAYDEIAPARMSSATSFYATFQQLTLSLGVCIGAAALHLGMLVEGRAHLSLQDFTLAFLIVTAISAAATIWNLRFSDDAGASMGGRLRVR
jgi:EmrB/QacA subfamily drug resistance transporter